MDGKAFVNTSSNGLVYTLIQGKGMPDWAGAEIVLKEPRKNFLGKARRMRYTKANI